MTIPVFDLCGKTVEYYQNCKTISEDRENYDLCVARDRWQEMEYSLKNFGVAYLYNGEEYWMLHQNGKRIKVSSEFLNEKKYRSFSEPIHNPGFS